MSTTTRGSWKSDRHKPEGGERKNFQRGLYWRATGAGIRWGIKAPGMANVQSVAGKREAALAAYLDASKRKSEGAPPLDTTVRISTLAESLVEAKRASMKPRAFSEWMSALQRVLDRFGHRRPASISADEIADFRRELSEGRSRATVIKYEAPLREVLNVAVRRRAVTVNPFTLLTSAERVKAAPARKARLWNVAELRAILEAATLLDQRPEARQAYAPLTTFLVYSGCRIGEALGLRWADVDLLGERITVNSTLGRDGTLGSTKTEAGIRTFKIPSVLLSMLVNLKPLDATDSDFVFQSKEGTPLGYWNARDRGVKLAMQSAGVKDARVHDLRHAAASLLYASGLNLQEIGQVLGHASEESTKTYVSWFGSSDGVLDKAAAAFDILIETGEVAA